MTSLLAAQSPFLAPVAPTPFAAPEGATAVSDCGALFAAYDPSRGVVVVYDSVTEQPIREIPAGSSVGHLSFSPGGTTLVTWRRPAPRGEASGAGARPGETQDEALKRVAEESRKRQQATREGGGDWRAGKKCDDTAEVSSVAAAAGSIAAASLDDAADESEEPAGEEGDGAADVTGDDPKKTLVAWSVADGTPLLSLSLRVLDRSRWPVLQFSGDDAWAAHPVTNGALIYRWRDAGSTGPRPRLDRRLPVPSLDSIGLAPRGGSAQDPPPLAAFVPGKRGNPGRCAVYAGTSLLPAGARAPPAGSPRPPPPQPLAARALPGAQEAAFRWEPRGSACLIVTEAAVDRTNQSYYGQTGLALWSGGDSIDLVPQAKEGPVHAARWAPEDPAADEDVGSADPSGTNKDTKDEGKDGAAPRRRRPRPPCFVVVAGFMPARAVVHGADGAPVYDVGGLAANEAHWSPSGRFLALCGFGNLPGDVVFLDRTADGKMRRMGEVRCPSVSFEWSPCGRAALVATTAPRLRVDNGWRLLKYTGEQLAHTAVDVLLGVRFLGMGRGARAGGDATGRACVCAACGAGPVALCEDRPMTPKALRKAITGASSGGEGKSGNAGAGAAAAPKLAGAFVPPHLRRAQAGGGSVPGASAAHGRTPAQAQAGGARRLAFGNDGELGGGGRVKAGGAGGAPRTMQGADGGNPFAAIAARKAQAVPGIVGLAVEEPLTAAAKKNAKKKAAAARKRAEAAGGGE